MVVNFNDSSNWISRGSTQPLPSISVFAGIAHMTLSLSSHSYFQVESLYSSLDF